MEILISRKYLLLIFLSSMYQNSIGQCPTSLNNMVLKMGELAKLLQPLNRKCGWEAMPANHFYNAVRKVTNSSSAQVVPDFVGSVTVDLSGLTILPATIDPVAKWSSAGLYIMEDYEAKCKSSAKVAVIQSGPTCLCNSSKNGKPAEYSCSVTYSDSPAVPMYAQFTWSTANQKDQVTHVPLARRKSLLLFEAVSRIPLKNKGPKVANMKPKTCEVTFLSPPHARFPSIARNSPTYSESCSFNCN